ncbi:MAG: hypothetical protein FWD87_05135 [Spirochaetaceae bacterium]|nr:hypothetical protein [Spirochaetaceae bacterium]
MEKESKLELCFLNEEQENEIMKKRYEYTDHDIAQLCCLSQAIKKLSSVTIYYLMYQDKDEAADLIPIFDTIEMLIKPINSFLFEGAPVRKDKVSRTDPGDEVA